MKNEQEFIRMILQNKSTIYTVCYMFSKDKDEVADLFQDILVRLSVMIRSGAKQTSRHGFTA